MASVRQRGKKKAWYALFRDATGVLIEKRTKATTRKEALSIAEEFERMARPSANAQTVEQVRRVVADLHRRYLGKELPKMSVRGYGAYWLDAKANEISPITLWFYSHALELFFKWLGDRADQDLFTVTKEDVVRFRDSEAKRVAPKTVNHELKVVRMLFRQAKADGWTPENPAETVKTVKKDRDALHRRSPKRPFTVEEMQRVMAVADDEWRAMIIRGYYTGQRLKDIATMRTGDEDLMRKTTVFVTSKTGRVVQVQMHPAYEEFVIQQTSSDDPDAPLHPRAAATVRKNGMRTVTLSNQFARLLIKARLKDKRDHKKREHGPGRSGRRVMGELGFHSLRHSFVSHLKDAGVAPQFVEEMVGHDDAAMNLIYTRLDPEVARREISKLPSIL